MKIVDEQKEFSKTWRLAHSKQQLVQTLECCLIVIIIFATEKMYILNNFQN